MRRIPPIRPGCGPAKTNESAVELKGPKQFSCARPPLSAGRVPEIIVGGPDRVRHRIESRKRRPRQSPHILMRSVRRDEPG